MSLFTDNCLFNSNYWDFLTKPELFEAILTKSWYIFVTSMYIIKTNLLSTYFRVTDNCLLNANCWDFLTKKYKNDHQGTNYWKLFTHQLVNHTKSIILNVLLIVLYSQLLESITQSLAHLHKKIGFALASTLLLASTLA